MRRLGFDLRGYTFPISVLYPRSGYGVRVTGTLAAALTWRWGTEQLWLQTRRSRGRGKGAAGMEMLCCPVVTALPCSWNKPYALPKGCYAKAEQKWTWWATGSEKGCCLCVKVVAIPESFSTSIQVLALPVSHREVHTPPQPQLHYLLIYSDFISPLSPRYHSGSSRSVAQPVWFSLSPCSICSIRFHRHGTHALV